MAIEYWTSSVVKDDLWGTVDWPFFDSIYNTSYLDLFKANAKVENLNSDGELDKQPELE